MKKKAISIILIVLALLVITGAVVCRFINKKEDKETVTVTKAEKTGEYDLIYDGLAHRIIICEPDVIDDKTDIIVMLHGYGSTATQMRQMTHMEEKANARGYIVVYITGAPEENDPKSAYGWNASWNSRLTESSKDDVGLLKELVKYIKNSYELDSCQAFVAGFSNGAYMTYRLAVEAGDTFEACASVSGRMTAGMWQTLDGKETAGMLQINGTADNAVPMRINNTAAASDSPAIEDVMEYLAKVNNCVNREEKKIGEKSTFIKWTGISSKQMWEIIIEDGGHCWTNEGFSDFDTNDMILDYFEIYR